MVTEIVADLDGNRVNLFKHNDVLGHSRIHIFISDV